MQNNKTECKFLKWNNQKRKIHFSDIRPFFREGEVRWAYLGKNIGTESIGKGQAFARPVLILKKVFGNSAIAIPLSSQEKNGTYYFNFATLKNTKHCALLTQVRYLDGKRILEKISSILSKDFIELKKEYFKLISE